MWMNEVAGISDDRSDELSQEVNDAISASKSKTWQEVYLRLNLPKKKIREQRYICVLFGLYIQREHDVITLLGDKK